MKRAPLLFCSAWLAAACAASKPYLKVRNVRIEGNQSVADKPILAGLVTRKPAGLLVKDYAPYDEVSVERDRERIEAFFHRVGYFSAEVTGVETKRQGEFIDVTFDVKEGEPTRVASVDVYGYPGGRLPETVRLPAPGAVFRHDDYLRAKLTMKDALVSSGYAHSEVGGAVSVDRDERTADVNVQVDPGPAVRFGELSIRGARRIPRSAILARVDWKEGDRFDPERMRLTQGRLYQLGFFSSVNVEVAHEGRPELAPTKITVRESVRHELTLGIGAAVDDANVLIRPRAGYRWRPGFDPLLTLEVDARPGIIVMGTGDAGNLAGEVALSAERHDTFFPRLRSTGTINAEVVELETYSALGGGVRVGLDRPFVHDRLLAGFGYRYRVMDFRRVSDALSDDDRALVAIPPPSYVEGFGVEYKLGFFEQSLALDLRDDPVDARRGIYAELRLEESGVFSVSEFTYVKLTPEVRAYYAPWDRLVFAVRARYGTAFGENLPITQRYFSGGSSSQRGFTYHRLAPMSSGMTDKGRAVPIGGSRQMETSAELRLDIFKLWKNWLGLATFLDGADVTIDEIPNPGNLHWAAGIGLRYNTLIGPIRFDVGYRLNRFGPGEPDPGDRLAFHLSLGEAF